MKVYTVEMGESGEGGAVYATYASRSGAEVCADVLMKNHNVHNDQDWKEVTNIRIRFELSVVRAWAQGCDWITIHEREVYP